MAIHYWAFGSLCSFAVAPLIAACVAALEQSPWHSRVVAWVSLSIGLGWASTVPFYTLLVADSRHDAYRFAPLFGLYGFLLGAQIVRLHLRRLDGVAVSSRPTAAACGVFALLTAGALVPMVGGENALAACGEFGAEHCPTGTFADYVKVVVPVVLAMGFEVWVMLRPPRLAPVLGETA